MSEKSRRHKKHMEVLHKDLGKVIKAINDPQISSQDAMQIRLTCITRHSFSHYQKAKDFVLSHEDFSNMDLEESLNLPFLPDQEEIRSLPAPELKKLVESFSKEELGEWFIAAGSIMMHLRTLQKK